MKMKQKNEEYTIEKERVKLTLNVVVLCSITMFFYLLNVPNLSFNFSQLSVG